MSHRKAHQHTMVMPDVTYSPIYSISGLVLYAMSGPVDIEVGLYDHFTLEEILSDLDNWAQRLSEYASQAEKLRRLIMDGKVSPVICEDLLMKLGDMAELGRRDADALRLSAIKKMKKTETEASDLQYRREALEIRFALNKISREEYEKALAEATKRLEESRSRIAILENLVNAINQRCARIEEAIAGKMAPTKEKIQEEPINLMSTLNGQKQGGELAKAILSQPSVCSRCGSGNPANAEYCWNCKASLSVPVKGEEGLKKHEITESPEVEQDAKAHLDALRLVRCPKCGSENLALAPFCYNCKAKIATFNIGENGSSEPLLKR
jgi:ribosomal protein L40E